MNVLRTPQREMQQAGADRRLRDSIDQQESTEVAVLFVRLENDWAIELQVADPYIVQPEHGRRDVLERVDVHFVFQRSYGRRRRLSSVFQQIRSAWKHRLVMHPDYR